MDSLRANKNSFRIWHPPPISDAGSYQQGPLEGEGCPFSAMWHRLPLLEQAVPPG